jgi:hypothetical protein
MVQDGVRFGSRSLHAFFTNGVGTPEIVLIASGFGVELVSCAAAAVLCCFFPAVFFSVCLLVVVVQACLFLPFCCCCFWLCVVWLVTCLLLAFPLFLCSSCSLAWYFSYHGFEVLIKFAFSKKKIIHKNLINCL